MPGVTPSRAQTYAVYPGDLLFPDPGAGGTAGVPQQGEQWEGQDKGGNAFEKGLYIIGKLFRWRINWPDWIVTRLFFREAGCPGPSSCSQVDGLRADGLTDICSDLPQGTRVQGNHIFS